MLGCKHAKLQYLQSYFLADIAARSSPTYATLTAIRLIDFTKVKHFLESKQEEVAYQYVNDELESRSHNSDDRKEGLRSREKVENLQLKIGDIEERFWRIIGQIKTLFNDDKIENFVKEIQKAEKELGVFDKDNAKDFSEIDCKIDTEIRDIWLDKDDKNKYAENPNVNRNLFVDEKIGELKVKRKSTSLEVVTKIEILESKIGDLLNYLENILKKPQYCRDCKLFCSTKTCPLKPLSQEEKNEK